MTPQSSCKYNGHGFNDDGVCIYCHEDDGSQTKASEYPPYACDCCGVTNGDMFWDYIEHNDSTLTYAEVKDLCDEFDSYRKQWNTHAEATREAVRNAKPRKSHKGYVKSSPYWNKLKKSVNGQENITIDKLNK